MKKIFSGKIARLLLYIAVLFVLLVINAFIWGKTSNEFSNNIGVFLFLGLFCFAGSIFYILAYDTLYKEDAEEKTFLQKFFIFIGLAVTVFLGLLFQSAYFQNFDLAKSYSPWAFALAAPWLMSGLLTLLLFEIKFKKSNGITKLVLPYLSLIVCYVIYVALGYAGRNSSFVYAGIGLIICGIIFVILVLRWRGITSIADLFSGCLYSGNSGGYSSDTNTDDNSESKATGGRKWASDPDYKIKSAIDSLILKEIYGKEYRFSAGTLYAEVEVTNFSIYPDVSFSGQFSGVSITLNASIETGLNTGFDSPNSGDNSELQSKICNEISKKTKSVVHSAVGNLRKNYGNFDGSYKVEVTLES